MTTPIGAGLLGTGHGHAAGKLHVLQESSDYELVGVAEPDPEWRARNNANPAYEGVRWISKKELLEDPRVEMVAVESVVQQNLDLAHSVIAAGKHLHLDKAPGTSLPDLRALFEAAQRQSLTIQMGYMFRYNPGFELVLKAVRGNWLGDVYYVHASMPSDISMQGRKALAFHPGGMMLELGCHVIDRVVELLGRPNRVTPFIRRDSTHDDGLADNTVAIFEYSRALAVVETAAMEVQPMQRRHFEVVGDKGTIILQPMEPPAIRMCLRQPRGGYDAGWQTVEVSHKPRYEEDLAELARVIRGEQAFSYLPEHDLVAQETVLRACGTPP